MQSNTPNKTSDKTLRWVFLTCFLIALLQTIIIRGNINAAIIGEAIGTFIALIAITGIIGIIINLILKNKMGYWIGLAVAVVVDIFVIINQ